MSEPSSSLFGAICTLFAVPCYLFVRFNRREGFGSSPLHRHLWWSGRRAHGFRLLLVYGFFILFGVGYTLLWERGFAGSEGAIEESFLGFAVAQAIFWILILIFPPALREDRSELSQRASARAHRRRSKPPLWLALGLAWTFFGTFLLVVSDLGPEWRGRLGCVFLPPGHLLLGFFCISSLFRVALPGRTRWGFVAAFFVPPCIALVAA